jgi:hypothetical protein
VLIVEALQPLVQSAAQFRAAAHRPAARAAPDLVRPP